MFRVSCLLIFLIVVPSTLFAERYDLHFAARLALYGEDRVDKLGAAVVAGDFDGDGIDDIAVSAPGVDLTGPDRVDAGCIYILFGDPGRRSLEKPVSLSTADVVILGADEKDQIGLQMTVGDLDGDGRADLVVGTLYGDGPENAILDCGETYIFFGRERSAFPDTIDLLETAPDLFLSGAEVKDYMAGDLAMGDLDGDGLDDLALGAFYGDGFENRFHHAGEVYILFGAERDALPGRVNLADTSLVTIYGAEGSDTFGRSIALGDLDGDGHDDLIVGAYYADGPGNKRINTGATYVFFGRPRHEFPLAIDLSLDREIVIHGEMDGDVSGRAVAAADMDRDGRQDLIIGAHCASSNPEDGENNNSGACYIIYGRPRNEFQGIFDLRTDSDCRISSLYPSAHLGWPIIAGPIDKDGNEGILAIAKNSMGGEIDRHVAGEAFLIPSRQGRAFFRGRINVEQAALLSLVGQDEEDYLGYDGALLDWNGDGRTDIAIGIPEAHGTTNRAGNSGELVVFFMD